MTINRIKKFTEDRDWDQFHSPANLAKSIIIEAAELLECFQWSEDKFDLQQVKEELADKGVSKETIEGDLKQIGTNFLRIGRIQSTAWEGIFE